MKDNLISLLNDVLLPLHFKRKGNNWVSNGAVISKIVNLQKSNYCNTFYINYGVVLRHLPLTTTMLVEKRLASVDREEQGNISKLLDLDIPLPIDERLKKLETLLKTKVVAPLSAINSEKDLLDYIKAQPTLNAIPLIVKQYFNL